MSAASCTRAPWSARPSRRPPLRPPPGARARARVSASPRGPARPAPTVARPAASCPHWRPRLAEVLARRAPLTAPGARSSWLGKPCCGGRQRPAGHVQRLLAAPTAAAAGGGRQRQARGSRGCAQEPRVRLGRERRRCGAGTGRGWTTRARGSWCAVGALCWLRRPISTG